MSERMLRLRLLLPVHVNQNVVVRTVDLFDQSVHLPAGPPRYGQQVDDLHFLPPVLPGHGPQLGGREGSEAGVVDVDGEVPPALLILGPGTRSVAPLLRQELLRLRQFVATEALVAVLEAGQSEACPGTVRDTPGRTVVSQQLDELSLQQPRLETVLVTPDILPGLLRLGGALAVPGQARGIYLASTDSTH